MYGVYEKTIKRNEKTGETDFLFASDGTKYTVHAEIPFYNKLCPLEVTGRIEKDGTISAKHVRAFGFSEEADKAFLLSKIFRGVVSEETAKKIIDKLGTDIFEAASHINGKYSGFGIPKEDVELCFQKLAAIRFTEDVYDYVKSCGGDYSISEKLIKTYGKETLQKIKDNPYLMLYSGLEFSLCEKKASEQGFAAFDTRRLKAIVFEAVRRNGNDGNTTLTFKKLVKAVKWLETNADAGYVTQELFIAETVCDESKYHIEAAGKEIYVYPISEWDSETNILMNVRRLETSKVMYPAGHLSVSDIEKKIGVKYSCGQEQAFNVFHESGIKIITGGPGTGKTTLLKGLLMKFRDIMPGRSIVLCAPTGCAARRMKDSCGQEASTIHSLLHIRPYETAAPITEKLDADLVVVDESSMIDTDLMSALLSSIKNGATVLLLGDSAQLPSVGPGNVLSDMIQSERFELYTLKEVFRQTSGSVIIDNAVKISHGGWGLKTDRNFSITTCENEQELFDKAESTANAYIKNKTDFRIYAPARQKKFDTSTINLNRMVQSLLPCLSKNETIEYGDYIFSTGDLVIFNKNVNEGPSRTYFNGEEGKITYINKDLNGKCTITVETDDGGVSITNGSLDDIEPAYALTAHKAQGGECDNAVIVVPKKPASMLQRKLLYVEVTRAKKSVTILSEQDAYKTAISYHMERTRTTGLLRKLTAA